MCEHPLCCHLMKARQVSKAASMLDCREPIDFYKVFMRGDQQVIVQQTNVYGKHMFSRWNDMDIEEMKRFLALCMQVTIAMFPRIKNY
ncbi:hypothetical protein KIN20_020192 [Parelaphostrongylus tenuis]|uniref:Uncharacterized protein n=1 Tax=Parelaphostrongylus tenuis TaxID=148309 RepID=A0AAD5MSJ5_PARTN|nr:hypothetical protein KIN20_020192 [Parelaphostrongylus tenuis]